MVPWQARGFNKQKLQQHSAQDLSVQQNKDCYDVSPTSLPQPTSGVTTIEPSLMQRIPSSEVNSSTRSSQASQDVVDFLAAAQRICPEDNCNESICTAQSQASILEPHSSLYHAGLSVVRGKQPLARQLFDSCTHPNKLTLLEVFVSSACSSSVVAESAIIRALAARNAEANSAIYPIAYHVDYWNQTGWVDPFACPASHRRQLWYQGRVKNASRLLYTPQVVVNGQTQMVGTKVAGMLDGSSRSEVPSVCQLVSVDIELVSYENGTAVVEPAIQCCTDTLQQLDPTKLVLMAMIVDEGACEVYVSNGCNKGKHVQHVNIAVAWQQLRLKHFQGYLKGIQVGLTAPQGEIWSDHKAVVAFLSDKRDGRVLGFCRHPLPPNGVGSLS